MSNVRLEYIKQYIEIIKSGNKLPSISILAQHGISRKQLDSHFGNIDNLRKEAKKISPKLFEGCIEESDYTSFEYSLSLIKQLKKYKRFVITSAVNGNDLNSGFYLSLKNYCKINKAKLLIIPCEDKSAVKNQFSKGWFFDPLIKDESFVFTETNLNNNISISSIRINVNQVDPNSGIGRLTHKQGSFIFGSPKQSLQYYPTSNLSFPRASMSTGVITNPKYDVHNRRTYISNKDHVLGAIIVEIESNEIYHFTQVQAETNGTFAHLGKAYSKNKVKSYKPEAFVLGDLHAGEHDMEALNCFLNVAKATGVKKLVLHDVFNGVSINHHEIDNLILRSKRSEKGELSLKEELRLTAEVLNDLMDKGFELIIVDSNHNDFLHRYLKAGTFIREPNNYSTGVELTAAYLKGVDPLIYGLNKYGQLKSKIKFLTRHEDYLIQGIQLAAHGDLGANGKRNPSKSGIENAYGSAVVGHSHTPGILRDVFQVGTTSKLKLGYNVGSSSWSHTSCLVYNNGQRQLINSINGKYKI
jgi:hypothetical protein